MLNKLELEDSTLPYFKITSEILDCCFVVMNELGTGFLEAVYKNALYIALKQKGLDIEVEQSFNVYFRGRKVGFYRADLVVKKSVIIELKSCSSLLPEHNAQVINYLKGN
jgi:GxxExxY protein